MKDQMFRIFSRNRNTSPVQSIANTVTVSTASLAFDELTPLLAKQLSELETQIGQLAQVQFELAEERQKMRFEMDALKKAVLDSQAAPVIAATINSTEINKENEAP